MTAYAFWNNKGGVGKSFLSFVAATEYARRYPDTDVYVIDMCPQASISETLLVNPDVIHKLMGQTPRATVAGYLEARLNSPFRHLKDVSPYVCRPRDFNAKLPVNLLLVCGDNLLEILSGAIRQISEFTLPEDAWKQTLSWIKDLMFTLRKKSNNRDTLFIFDCNPSFAIYTQLALASAENVVVPFTPDDSSRRAVENVVALLYGNGMGNSRIETYAQLNFAKSAKEEGLAIPKLHTFVSNRIMLHEDKASKTFEGVSASIKKTLDVLHKKHRQIYATPRALPSERFIEIPDYHSACTMMTIGIPSYHLQPGLNKFRGKQVQLEREALKLFQDALANFVAYL